MKLVLVLLIAAFSTFGQQPQAAIAPDDFMRIFQEGFRVTVALGKEGFRYTATLGDAVLLVETDRRGVARVSYSVSGIVESEGIVNGDRIYERTGQGPWTIRTQAEYKAEQTARSEALEKARAEKDQKTYELVRAEVIKRIFVQASVIPKHSQIFWRPFRINGTMSSFASPGVDDKVLTALGRSVHKGKAVRHYRFSGTWTAYLPRTRRSDGVRKNLNGLDYWFDDRTGAVVKIRTQRDWSSDIESGQDIAVYEWELDPHFEIKVPVIGE